MKHLLLSIFLLFSFFSKASHISGGQITYQCLGNNVYQVKLTYFWDCEGGFNPGTTQPIIVSGCGNTLNLTVTQSTLTPGDGVLADGLCPNSGLNVCKKRIEYLGTITLPSTPCNNWVFSIGSCCRGGNITNITNGTVADYYHFATLNNTTTSCNNSPDISIGTLPNFCVNQPACFNLGATEVDGHTLSYAFISAYEDATTFVTYSGGFSGTSPITGISIDPTTGQINFVPTMIGDFVVTVQITERDSNGNIVGTIMRDFQVIVTNCNNQTVTCGQGAISNVTSGTVPGGNGNTLQICENIPFCFDITFTDPDVADSIKLSSPNILSSLPGSTMVMSYTPGVTNKIKATICWTPPQGSSGLNTNFVMIVKDNACPVPGTQVLNYFIDVLPATSAGPDRIICGSQTASINATGSSTVFAWSDLAGNPIPVGPAFSCNPCNNPVIKPAVTSTYVVTNVGGGLNCKNKDTLIITVVPDFTLTANAATTSGCLNAAVQFTSNVSPAGPGYSYTWSPSAPLTSTNTANTSAVFLTPGTYNYTLTAMSSLGCLKQTANIAFTANPVVTPQFTVVPTNTTVCASGSIPLSINFNSAPPTSCGLAATGCAVANTIQVGTSATSGSTANYTPYGGLWESQKNQYLFTASELIAAGIIPGKLNSIAFNVTNFNGNVTTFENFTIKLKCVSYSTLPTTTMDNTGLVQVYNPTTINATLGWNTYNFSQSYEWDGTSNLLVDVCYFNPDWDGNLSVEYSTLGFIASKYVNNDGANQCPLNTVDGTGNQRPNTRFGNCSSTPPSSAFSYSWSPATGLSSTSVPNPTANITSSVQYTVVVTPLSAATCSNTGTTTLTVISPATPTISAVAALCTNAPTFTLSAVPVGGTWSLTAATSTAGVFTPSLAAIGNNTITYSYGGTGCMQTSTAVIGVEQFIPSNLTGTINVLCITNPTINLNTLPANTTGVWSGNGVTGSVFSPTLAGAGTHTLSYTTNSTPTASLCPSTSTIAVAVSSNVQPVITPAGPYCDSASVQTLVATPTGGVWSAGTAGTNISATGQFAPGSSIVGSNKIYYALNNAPCISIDSILIDVIHFTPATITGIIGPYCIYNPAVNLQSASQFPGGIWSGNGVSGNTFDPSVAGAGTWPVTYSTSSGGLCPDSKTISVLVNAKPIVNAVPDNFGGCNYPWTVKYTADFVTNGTAVWNFGDGRQDTGLVVYHTYTTPGTYLASVTYTDNIGCYTSTVATNSVTIYPVPDADFEPSVDVTTIVDGEITFTNQTNPLANNSYVWDIGGLETTTTTNPVYTFVTTGDFFVTLFATSVDGCKDTVVKKVTVNPDVVLYVPNAFTPGGDGLNDVFRIVLPPTGVDFTTFELVIYDRWGELIFKTNDVNDSWNGSKNNSGAILKQDTYVYKIIFKDVKKTSYEKLGHITLIRK